ncbi:transglutaminase domain-containing protein [Salinibacterium sp. ZJ70]|uniref:transglutaminase family protein n=1 Tax=Salinibacterium sp. ZJ70 TaxID=2708084 RepID=UPI00142339B9|nr:transglutaminase domain-containing protein [Salinibacterium sp. ZJ70]
MSGPDETRGAARGGSLADVFQLWLTMGIASMALWPIYRSPQFLVLAAVAIVLGTLIAALSARMRWPGWVSIIVTTAVFALVGVPLAVPDKAVGGVLPSPDGLADLFAGVALGWKQLLTITLPVGDYQALLVPALVLLLGGTVVAGTIAFRARLGEFAAVIPAVVFVVGIAFGPSDAPLPPVVGVAMLIVCVAWGSWRRWRRRREVTRRFARDAASGPLRFGVEARTLVAAVAILAVTATGAVAAVAALPPHRERDVLRNAVAQPFDPRDYASPLAEFRRYLRDDRVDEVMLRVEGLPSGARMRIATLDSFDGVVYAVGSATVDSASGTFVRLPSAVPRPELSGQRVELDIAVDAYTGVWVPTVGDLVSVTFTGPRAVALDDGLAVNLTSGTAADMAGLRAGDSYRLTTVLPDQPSIQALVRATPGSADTPRIADPPDDLVAAVDEATAGAGSPGARLVAAVDWLRASGYISHGLSPDEPASRSGHSLDRLAELVDAPLMIGDAEQYAVAAALVAHRIGFPVRVVMGFAPESAGADGATIVRGSDVTAWIEVETAEHGWVAIDPVPPPRPIPDEEPQDPTTVSRPESIVPPPADRPDPREDQTEADTTAEEPVAPDLGLAALLQVLRVIGIGALALLVLLSPFLLVLAAKARRRHLRRTAPSALGRIRGGWDEFADLVVDHGLPVSPAATRSEVAAVVGTLPSRVLAAVVDRAVFAPGQPADADAERVWNTVTELRSALDSGRSRRARLRARVSLRSLGGGKARNVLRRSGAGR